MSSMIVRRPLVPDNHLSGVAHPTLRQIFASRGVRSDAELDNRAKSLLHYDQLVGIDAATAVLTEALHNQKKIIIIGDFDADGATSTALTMLCLSQMGASGHSYLVPNRFDFGYGLSPEIVEVAHQQGAEVIVTVDNGIACFAGVLKAQKLGIQVVITDHHLAAETLPPAEAIVNPNQPGCGFLSKNLAGVGVAFYLMLALRSHLKSLDWFAQKGLPEPNLAAYLDIVALGTIADVVPLDRNNRVLVHQGLQRIRSGKCRVGISALIDVAGKSAKRLVATDLGFVLGPRLNAAGRLDDMSLGIECLLAEDPNLARRMAVELDSMNQERRNIQESMQQEALASLEGSTFNNSEGANGIVLYQADYHQGVIGIVAGKIKEKYNRPTIAFAHQDDALLKGSARSIQGVHIRDVLEEINSRYPGMIDKFGGHAMAAGLSLQAEKLSAFEQVFEQVCAETLKDMDVNGQVVTDGELAAEDFSLAFAQQLKDAGPWGQGFTEPLFDGEFEVLEQRLLGNKHLKMMVKHPSGVLIDAIAFNIDNQLWPNRKIKHIRLAYKLDINEFRGKTSLQLMVDELEALNE
ncbi:single-stranded-DNA-specific exonuclease RecJ [Aliiglaciecola sp. LCG003]|uniref:single-stranded-DNA-specific exonuclease RecJ n=1 Tax=Aliiglaciecola sp. LCG003 TaxID=3053655 RepID=UPI002574035F|nr:single-stranded-DNA-specific exonuclease RecJ [Aliiglaciecola sp. LCG003]WJG10194.1 single-stranded-DNA-specific exonuclease RecJ [Aliiglaciecola sp. LCG003]